MPTFEDIIYAVDGSAAVITINRPEVYNAFRAHTVVELIGAFRLAWADTNVHSVILTGAGDEAFCSGGDQKQRAKTGDYGSSPSGMFEIGNLHKIIRDIPKPTIAAVNGIAVGGGHVLHVLCDVSIASETARFGQEVALSVVRTDHPGTGHGADRTERNPQWATSTERSR
jgi:naphthoate synthase